MRLITHYILLLQLGVGVLGQAYYTKIYKESENGTSCTVLDEGFLPHYKILNHNESSSFKIDTEPAIRLPESGDEPRTFPARIIDIYAKTKEILEFHLRSKCEVLEGDKVLPETHRRGKALFADEEVQTEMEFRKPPEIRKLVDSGDPKNRIDVATLIADNCSDVVFMGDGYTAAERVKFFDDISRFVQQMFVGVTFQSYLPLFNIWAIYVESQESGIGYDGPKNTPFKLYREKGQLRGVFTKNPEYARQVCKLTGPQACDFPSLVGNDDYYGGLGGEFVIVTSSNQTGKIVLRHEMGHNFLVAGEEYDNGYAYFGANAAHTLSNLKWSHWLSGKPREERAMYRILSYPWSDLEEDGPYNKTFISDGRYSRWQLTVSVTASQEDDDLEFLMDGKRLPWKSTGVEDREFYNWDGKEGFSFGFHHFAIRSKSPVKNAKVPRMICSIALHEFGSEEEFHMENDYVSAYPTWNFLRKKSYRPTNAGCLMRNMTQERFCPVCQESMWIQFLSTVSLIDGLSISNELRSDGTRGVNLKTLQFGQFRPEYQRMAGGEFLQIRWLQNSKEIEELQDQPDVFLTPGNWTVTVKFINPEVRYDPYGVLHASKKFEIV